MTTVIKVDTLHNMLDSEQAEDRGFNELVANGYEDDMKDMYACVLDGDIMDQKLVTKELIGLTIEASGAVDMAVWARGRLFYGDTVVAHVFKGYDGQWVIENADAEWMC